MVQILVQVDDALAARLEKVAPGKSRKRSEFIGLALRKALMELEDSATRAAYERQPDDEPVYLDAAAWAPRRKKRA
jgi:metal-responsive CopG/Arc/MetJ family transcriptional regulator